jgi:hypothetical protein
MKNINLKICAKIRRENDEIISGFNHVMIKTINKISKQVIVEVKNHIVEKKAKEPNFKKTDPKLIGKKLV